MHLTKTICQLGFRCGQESSQPATMASGFDRIATRNPQLHIVPSVTNKPKKETTVVILQSEKRDKMNSQRTKQHIRKPRHTSQSFSLQKS